MIDYTLRKYAKWLEETAKSLVNINPDSIYVGAIKNGEVISMYWNVHKDERAAILQEILQLGIIESLENNRDLLADMVLEALDTIKGEDEDEEEFNEEYDEEGDEEYE